MHEVGEAEIPAVLLAVAIVALVSLGIYHRAKAIAARNVEVRKLQRLAADEAAWVEAAAAEEYTSMVATSSSSANRNQSATTNPLSRWTITATNNTVERHPTAVDSSSQAAISLAVCVVCSTPTVKRCSQCKLVKYCSSKCQVQHWREGHKLECHVPKVSSTCKNKTLLAEASSQNKALLAEANSENTRNSGINNAETVLVSVQEKSAPAKTSRTLAVTALDGSLPKPNKILFPYEYFVKYFNWDRLPLSPCGLINCGNSCFANVVLQCLTYTRPLAAYLLQGSHTEECRRNDWCFMCELQSHVCRVKEGQNPFSPIRILSQIRNIGNHLGYGRQEDAHEFMRFAIDSMQSICLDEVGGEKAVDPRTQETTFIQHIFGGHLQSQVKCTECHHESDRYENMMDLAVEVQGNVESLEDALAQFTAPEWLDGENKYKCDRCNAYVKARKRLTVHEAPNILTIALKRYQSGKFGKLNKRVTFPEILDMSLYMSGKGDMPPHYHLYAVVVHVDMLNASFFGHYICYVKDLHGSWYKVDDSKVKEVDLEKVMQQKAYMLLYTRSAPRPAPEVDNGNGQSSSIASVNESCGVGNKTLLKGKDLRALDVPVSSTLSNGVVNANGKFPSFAGIHCLTDGEVSNSFASSVKDSGPVVSNSTADSCQSASISNFDDMKNLATCSTSPSCHLLEIESSLKVITNHVNSPEVMSDSDCLPLGAFPETTGEWGEVHENTKKLKLYTALSPLPIPRPLGTDQLPAWPFASRKRASSCPALLNFSSEHGSSLISVSEICKSQRKLEGEVDTLNPVRHLHVSNLEGLDPGDVVMSSMHSQHKIGGDNETSELQHNLEEISCRSNVTQHAPPSEILMGKVSGITVSQLGKANLSVDIDSSNEEYDGNPIITNGHSVKPDEHRKLATSMMLNLGDVKGTGNSEIANTPFLDTATVEDACNGVSFQMRAHHLHENGNGDCLQRKSVSKSERDACSTNSDASSLISVSESGYVPSQSESLQAPSQLSIPSVLEGRTSPKPPPLYTGSKFEKCSRESEDGISVLKPMFKPGFLNEASRRQFRFKAGDKKANANVISHILPNGQSNCGHGNSSHLSSTHSPLTMISDLVAVDTGVPCAAAYGEIQCNGATGSSDRVILRPITNNDGMIPRNSEQLIEVKSRHTDTKVTLNTCSSHASMEGEVQNGADAGTEKPLYKRERADTVDRLKDSQGATDVANDHISTAVNGLSLTSEYMSQQSGFKTLESLTDESVGSLKNSMGNHTFVMNTRKEKVGRNDNCTCGSHQKWKKCCGRAEILGRHLVV